MKPGQSLKHLRSTGLIWLSVLLVLLPISPLRMPLASRDSGVFLYIGWRILNGEIPYLHIWDHKPPLIFYLNALGLWLTDGSRWGVWLIELAALMTAAAISFHLVRRAFGTLAAVASLTMWLSALIFVIQGGNLTTEYTLPLQFACFWLVTGLDQPRHVLRRSFAIGLLCGLIFWTKQNAAGIGLAIALVMVASRLRSNECGTLARELLTLMAGFAAVSLTIGAWFASHNALGALWNAAFVYNFAYTTKGLLSLWRSMIWPLRYLILTSLLPTALVGYGLAVHGWRRQTMVFRDNRPLLMLCLVGLPLELLLYNISGRSYGHYVMPLLPYLAILTGLTTWAVAQRWLKTKLQRMALAGICITLLLFSAGWRFHSTQNQIASLSAGARVAAEIQAATSPTDTVLLWGAETTINFFAQRASPTRFAYQFPLYHPLYANEAIILEFLDAILAVRPAMIIDTGNPSTPIFSFPIDTPAIRERIAAIHAVYPTTSPFMGVTLYQPASASTR